jgi:hypothetical protein
MRERPSGRFSFRRGSALEEADCYRLATWQATAAEDLTGRWLLPERGLFRSLRKS